MRASGNSQRRPWALPAAGLATLAAIGSVAVIALTRTGDAGAKGGGTYIYWANGQSIARADLNGDHVKKKFVDDVGEACGVTIAGSHLLWGDDSRDAVGRSTVDGKNLKKKFIDGGSGICGVGTQGDSIYWANQDTGPDNPTPTPSIGKAGLEGSHANQHFIKTADAPNPCGLAVDSRHVYWADDGTDTVARADLDGSHVKPALITGADDPCGVAVTASHIYWANQAQETGTTIGRATLDGDHVRQDFIDDADVPCGIAVHGDFIYWTNSGFISNDGGSIGRAKINGHGVRENFITGTKFPCGIVVG